MISMLKIELVSLVERLMDPETDDETISEYIDILEKNVPHPSPSDLIFGVMRIIRPSKLLT